MLHNNDNTDPNETDKSAPNHTISGEHKNQIGALQAIVACDTNAAFAWRNLFFVLTSKVFQNFVPL